MPYRRQIVAVSEYHFFLGMGYCIWMTDAVCSWTPDSCNADGEPEPGGGDADAEAVYRRARAVRDFLLLASIP
jgi:hypothetical protein